LSPLPRRPDRNSAHSHLLSWSNSPALAEDRRRDSRGEYLLHRRRVVSCHTVAGRREPGWGPALLTTPFLATFDIPNITPDPETCIGRDLLAASLQALREGVRPDGAKTYFRVPISELSPHHPNRGCPGDHGLFCFLSPQFTVKNRPHDVPVPSPGGSCKLLELFFLFTPVPFQNPAPEAQWFSIIAGPILSLPDFFFRALRECHTPRNFIGATHSCQRLAVTPDGPERSPRPQHTAGPD